MLDFLGKEFEVGDTIVYPKMSGRSVALCKGVVLKFNDSGSVQVQPEIESWGGGRERSGTTKYINTLTGKSFDPWAAKNKEHIERDYGRIHKETGEYLSYEQIEQREAEMRANGGVTYRELDDFRNQYTWCARIFKDYVKEETAVKPVTITRTDNIILIEKAGG